MTTFITPLEPGPGTGPRLAVKDVIDVAGVPTTVGSPVLAERAVPAAADAACLAGFRAAGARIVGKANLHELCFGGTGVNPWFGTPVNPLDPARVPGGSSSGCAVALATGEADLALGTDTAGSIRNPSAYCGTVGLKTTYGRVPLEGVRPLAPSLDTVGPMARDVAGVALGMALLDPSFAPADDAPSVVGRFRGLEADPLVDEAVDRALLAAGFALVDIELPGWLGATEAAVTVLFAEALATYEQVVLEEPDRVGHDLLARFEVARGLTPGEVAAARSLAADWQGELAGAFEVAEVVALPTAPGFAPLLGESGARPNPACPAVNLAGVPALALPVPVLDGPTGPGGVPLPASLQLVGPADGEDRLLAAGARVEQALA